MCRTYVKSYSMCATVIKQSYPTTCFAAITAGRSRYCLEIFKAQERSTIRSFQKQNKFPSIWNLLRRNSQHLCHKMHSLLCMWLQPSIETQIDSLLINNIAENWECLNCKKNFTIVAIVCHRYKRLVVLQNVHAIILLWASEDLEKLFEETVR